MLRIKKFFKPFILTLIAVLALLFVQAFADLNLPSYMSDIVTIGIQQSGIEHASVEVMSQDAYQFIYSLSSIDNKNTLKANYSLQDGYTNANYPNAANQMVYVLNENVSDETRITLDEIIGESMWTLIDFGRAQAAASGTSSTAGLSMDSVDLQQLYAFSAQIQMMPSEMLATYQETAAAVSPLLKAQTGIVLAKGMLTELGVDLSATQMNFILKTGGIMILISFLGLFAVVLVGYFGAKMGAGVARSLRKAVFEKVETFSNEEMDRFSSASLITRSTNDITQIQQLVAMGTRIFFYAPIMAIGGIYMITRSNTSMVWIIGVAVSALLVLIAIIFFVAVPKFKITQKLVDGLNLVARENLTGLMVVRAFANQDFETKRYGKANRDLADVLLFVSRVMTTDDANHDVDYERHGNSYCLVWGSTN